VLPGVMATRSLDFLLSPAAGIEGSKLPSGEQVLGHFLHRHSVLKEDISTAANRTVDRVEDFWLRAKIPTKHRPDSIKKVKELFYQWKGLKKNHKRCNEVQLVNEAAFTELIKELFGIAHSNALELMENVEDKLFLQSQRKRGRPGCMGGVDKVTERKDAILVKKQKEKEEKLKKQHHRSELETQAILEKVLLKSSSDEEDSFQDGRLCTSRKSPPQKRGRKSVVSSQLSAMLDRTGVSDRAAMMIVFETSRALGHDPQALALNRSTIQRQRQQHRKASAASIKEAFKPSTTLTVHWDGKLMHDLTGTGKVERLPILVSTMGEKKLLAIPKISTGTGQAIANAVYNGIREWGLDNLIRSMCFDTTSSNTGRLLGACTFLEQLLGRSLLHFGCRHHILELVLAAAFGECMGPTNAPEILMFQRFRGQWASIDQESYNDISSDDFSKSELTDVRDEVIEFCKQQLLDHQPRDDYRDLLKLIQIFLGSPQPHGVKFRAPGPMHQARWMAKAIYSLKVWLFRFQFKLTAKESKGLRDINIFLAKVYLKFWFQAPVASMAARNDLQLLQQLDVYPQRAISTVTCRKIAGQLWYLSEDLILLSLFDRQVNVATKRAMLKASTETEGESDPLKRAVVDLAIIQQKTLVDFVSKGSRKMFATLGLPDGFLNEDPDSWDDREDYKTADAVVCSLAVINDHAERGVTLINDATQSGRFRDEEQLQYALQVIEENRLNFPDAKKSTLLKNRETDQ